MSSSFVLVLTATLFSSSVAEFPFAGFPFTSFGMLAILLFPVRAVPGVRLRHRALPLSTSPSLISS